MEHLYDCRKLYMLDSFFGHFRHFSHETQKPPNIFHPTTKENDADLFNKNLPGALHDKHAKKMLSKKGE